MSSIFDWDPAFSVNIASIDSQHKKLLAIGSELLDAMGNGSNQAITGGILDRLVQYTCVHFTFEERLMESNGYPDLATHKAQHDQLITAVRTFQENFNAGHTVLSIELIIFVKDWLVGHIQGSDRKYAPFIREKSAA